MARGGGGEGGGEEGGEREEEHPLMVEDKLEHRNPHPYRYTLNPGQDVCPRGEQIQVWLCCSVLVFGSITLTCS